MQGRSYLVLVAAPCLYLTIFFVWPLLRVVLRSVLEPRPGFGNYARVLFTGPYLQILLYTLEVAVLVTAVCLVVGYPVAALTARMRGTALRLMTGLIVGSLWTSAVIRSYAWMILFQRYGVVNQALVALGLADAPVRILQTTTAVVIGMVHILLPFMLLPLIAAMRRIDPYLLRAGRILGAGPINLFLRVYFPLSLPGVHAGTVLVFITSLGFFITPSLLGGGRTMMAAMIIEQEADIYLDWPMASSICHCASGHHAADLPAVRPTGAGRCDAGAAMMPRMDAVGRAVERISLGMVLTLLVVFLIAPIVVVTLMSFTDQLYLAFPPARLVLRWYVAVWNESRWLRAAWNSVQIGIATSILSMLLGTLSALAVTRGGRRWTASVASLVVAPMMLPHVIIAIGLYPTMLDLGLSDTYMAVVIGHAVIATPLVFTTVSSALRGYDPALELAAMTLGANGWRTFRYVTLPMIASGLAIGGIFAFAVSFDELMLALFLASPSTETLPRLLWEHLAQTMTPTIAAVATLILLTTLVLLSGVLVLRRSAVEPAP